MARFGCAACDFKTDDRAEMQRHLRHSDAGHKAKVKKLNEDIIRSLEAHGERGP